MTNPDESTVRDRFAAERLGPYLVVTGGNLHEALELYAWNVRIGAAMFESIHHVEVALRNAMHERLTAMSVAKSGNAEWYRQRSWFDHKQLESIDEATKSLESRNYPITTARMVAELGLGFWRMLLRRSYHETLWMPTLRLAFPLWRGDRNTMYASVDRINTLRNRIAHHEPIHSFDHIAEEESMLGVVGYICQDTRAWIAAHSRVAAVAAERPSCGHPRVGHSRPSGR